MPIDPTTGIHAGERTFISDDEAQLGGDVECAWVELREQAAAPSLPTDKVSALLYSLTTNHRVYLKTSAGATLDLTLAGSAPLTFKGTVAVAADFPTAALVESGWVYRVTADVTDNDATKTNTGLSFLAGSTIAWNGTTWTDMGEELSASYVAASPATAGAGDVLVEVDTATIGTASVINLPAVSATRVGKIITVADVSGGAAVYNIAVTPNGTDTIDGVNAALNIVDAYGALTFQCVQKGAAAYGWKIIPRLSTAENKESWQHTAASETLRVLRAKVAGRITAVHAETGTVAAAGESMTFDVRIAGTSCLTGVVTVDNTTVVDTPVNGTIDTAHNSYAAGNLITVVRTYVAGGGPTPMLDTVCGIQFRNA